MTTGQYCAVAIDGDGDRETDEDDPARLASLAPDARERLLLLGRRGPALGQESANRPFGRARSR